MSEFTVCRTLDTHPALRYCLLLDDVRIAGGKPDYRGDNILISWRTKETYGPVDAIKTENGQLATEKAALERRIDELCAEVEALKHDEWAAGFNAGCEAVEAAYEDGKAHYEDENAELRELCEDIYKRFRGVVFECWAYSSEDFRMYEQRMRELGIEVPS